MLSFLGARFFPPAPRFREEEGVGIVYLWGYFVGKEDMYVRDGLHLNGKGAAVKYSLENSKTFGYKCVCLNARSIVNKRNELNIMLEDTDPHIIGIT